MTDDGTVIRTRSTSTGTPRVPVWAAGHVDVLDHRAFLPLRSDDEETVVAAHELYAKLIGLWTPAIIEAAFDLGVYPHLCDEPVRSADLATVLSLDVTASRILLDGLHACGIVDRWLPDDGIARYRLQDRFAPLLLGTGSYHLVGKLRYDRTVAWPAWRRLADTIRHGPPGSEEPVTQNRNSEQEFASLVSGISFWAPHAVETVRAGLADDLGWDLSRPASVLDVGCGTGIYSHLLLRKQPGWTATGLDTPKVADIANEQAQRFGVADRFECRHADFLEDDWGPQRDVVLFVNVFHLFPPSTARSLVARAARAVRPGGCVCIIDHIVADTRGAFDEPQDRFAALFAVSMLSTGGGDAHRASDYEHWLNSEGLRPVALKATPMHRVLLAVDPSAPHGTAGPKHPAGQDA